MKNFSNNNSFNNSSGTNGIGMTSMRTRLRLIESLKKAGIHNEIVLNALSEIPRHLFVDEAIAHKAYENIALPIGFGQTISQPYIVARMTQAALGDDLHLKSVLEIGTGSGYQAAVLSKVADRVYTIERIKDLLDLAKQRFNNLRLYNVKTMYNDGYTGWVDHAPFDAIIVTCAAPDLPSALLEQLQEGGRLIIPVNINNNNLSPDILDSATQQLQIVTKSNDKYIKTSLELVKFVPLLTGKQ